MNPCTCSVREVIANGDNRWRRVLGHGTVNGVPVRVIVRVTGFDRVTVEYTDATRENDCWHPLASYSASMRFWSMMESIPSIAQFRFTPNLLDLAERASEQESQEYADSMESTYPRCVW